MYVKLAHVVLTIATLLSTCPARALANRDVPDDKLQYPVLITLKNCESAISVQGSGFYINQGSSVFLVTARHVLFNWSAPNHPLLCKQADVVSYPRDPTEHAEDHMLDLAAMNQDGKIKAHTTQDVAVIRVAELSPDKTTFALLPAVQPVARSRSGIVAASAEVLKKLDGVLVSNAVYVFGFPRSIGLQQIPQIQYERPLIRKGIVAGINDANKTIILDCLTFHGNSGGPVIQAERESLTTTKFYVIGVVSEFVPVAETWVNTTMSYFNMQIYNSGYSIVVAMDAVLELTEQ